MPQARLLILLPLLLGAVACTSNPRDALPPRPEHGLANARARAAQASTPAEEATLRRSILQRCLGLGWTQEAGREYLRLTVLHHSDDDLLRELCLATLRWALRDVDPARRVSALRVAGEARE
ncbi:MAG: hypothetical protein JKY65_33180, partial [Planctomycetes bacterium]|nr:hypothetical protein [Planctomycetota bacterium]